MNVYLIIAITDEIGYGMEETEDGRWYCRGSRCYNVSKVHIHSIHTGHRKAKNTLRGLRPDVEIGFADKNRPWDSPINYRKIIRFKLLRLYPGRSLEVSEEFSREEIPQRKVMVNGKIFSL